MNREIKFRAWVYSGFYEMINDYCFLDKSDFSFMGHDRTNNRYDVIAVMQFTGLHDSEGKEIYEGDVLEYDDRIFEVFYKKAAFYLKEKEFSFPFYIKNMDNLTIIGNIYENPNLIS